MIDKQNGLPERYDFSAEDREFMQMAIDLSVENIDSGGGPFGAVIVRDGKLIAKGANRVVPNTTPRRTLRWWLYAMLAGSCRHSTCRDVRFIPRVSPARCVLARSTGRVLGVYVMQILSVMPQP